MIYAARPPFTNKEIEKESEKILDDASGLDDVSAQIYHLTRAILLLTQVVADIPLWMAESR